VKPLATASNPPTQDPRTPERNNTAIHNQKRQMTAHQRVSVKAQQQQMSEPGFSRFNKRNTRHRYNDLMRKIREQRASRLLQQSYRTVADICL
ncbi:AraC family transcriptional regulator, partial [Pseudomonas sp. MH9.3]|nr:AraC family transcriptional regulator [Pseudomonas sp. MH9.3]